ncbi:MAG: hypothetical protein K2W95_35195 [Candidatus Obscuribacterales bacterium]|nr:hypothetical protein [Candidatus Obscuribacterales bacterium]
MSDLSIWTDIVDHARWAPTPHNTQHARFRLLDSRRAVLCYEPSRLLPVEDPRGQFMACGLGIVLEMAAVAAAHHDLDLEVRYLTGTLDHTLSGPQPYAELTLVPRTKPEPLSRELIKQRRTSRLPYDGDRPVSPTVLAELAAIAEGFEHQLEFSSDRKEVDWVLGLNADTMFYDLRDDRTRAEIGMWARYSMKHARKHGDGLAAHAMMFPGFLMWLFFNKNWIFQIPGLSHLCRALYLRSMRGTGTVAWISGDFQTPAGCVNAGRMLARVWLTMTRHGVYLHPFGSVITNERSHKTMEEHFANSQRKHPLWLLVRLGHSNVPPQAMRLSVDDLIVS